MEILDKYLEIEKEVHDYFDYEEDWVAIPIDDARKYYWSLTGEGSGDEVKYAEHEENVFDGTEEDGYSNGIYTQRFLPKWVYRGKDYTMICVDTRVDGNKFLQIFSNSKELTQSDPTNR